METAQDPKQIRTSEFRLSYPHIWVPEDKQDGSKKFQITMLFPNTTDLAPMQNAANIAAQEKWGQNFPANLTSPFRMGREDKPEEVGMIKVKAIATFDPSNPSNRPQIFNQFAQPCLDQALIYAGCWCFAVIQAWPYSNVNVGITFIFKALMFSRDDTPFVSRTDYGAVFSPLAQVPQQGVTTTVIPGTQGYVGQAVQAPIQNPLTPGLQTPNQFAIRPQGVIGQCPTSAPQQSCSPSFPVIGG